MTAGLLAKTALFPLHLWLPPAHAGAPPAASAVLSALVVKGSFFICWSGCGSRRCPGSRAPRATQLLAALGAGAILFGSVLALRQARLKLLVAYSTVAQIGYLFLMFPLAFDASADAARGRRGLDGRPAAGGLARAREGGDVHGRRPDRGGARARPHRGARRASAARCR